MPSRAPEPTGEAPVPARLESLEGNTDLLQMNSDPTDGRIFTSQGPMDPAGDAFANEDLIAGDAEEPHRMFVPGQTSDPDQPKPRSHSLFGLWSKHGKEQGQTGTSQSEAVPPPPSPLHPKDSKEKLQMQDEAAGRPAHTRKDSRLAGLKNLIPHRHQDADDSRPQPAGAGEAVSEGQPIVSEGEGSHSAGAEESHKRGGYSDFFRRHKDETAAASSNKDEATPTADQGDKPRRRSRVQEIEDYVKEHIPRRKSSQSRGEA